VSSVTQCGSLRYQYIGKDPAARPPALPGVARYED
jgi:hypothetical protein